MAASRNFWTATSTPRRSIASSNLRQAVSAMVVGLDRDGERGGPEFGCALAQEGSTLLVTPSGVGDEVGVEPVSREEVLGQFVHEPEARGVVGGRRGLLNLEQRELELGRVARPPA